MGGILAAIASGGRPVEVPTIQDLQARNMQLQALAQQGQLRQQQMAESQQNMQLNAIKMQEAQYGLQDQQTLRQVLPEMAKNPKYQTDGQFDMEKALPDIYPLVSPNTAAGIGKFVVETSQKRAEQKKNLAEAENQTRQAQAKEQELRNEAADHFKGDLQTHLDQGYNPAVLEAWFQNELTDPVNAPYKDRIAATHQQFMNLPVDQQEAYLRQQAGTISQKALEQRGKTAEQTAKTQETQYGLWAREAGLVNDQAGWDALLKKLPTTLSASLPPTFSPAARDQFVNKIGITPEKQGEAELKQMQVRMGLMGNSEYDQFLSAFAAKRGKTPATLTPDERLASFQQFAEFKQDPVLRNLAVAQRNDALVMHKMELGMMPTEEDARNYALDIQNHRLAPSQLSEIRGRGNGNLGNMIYREMKRQDPNFNWEEADATYNLVHGAGFQNTIRYMDSVTESLPHLVQNANVLAQGPVRSINGLVARFKDQFNNIDLKKFQTDRTLLADEVAKILQGGGTGAGTSDAKMRQAGEILRESDDPAAIAAAAGEIMTLIGYRRKALTRGTYLEGTTAGAGAGSAAGGNQPDVNALRKKYNY